MAVVNGRTAADRVLIAIGILGSGAIAAAAMVFYDAGPAADPPAGGGAAPRPVIPSATPPTTPTATRPSTQPPQPTEPVVSARPAAPSIQMVLQLRTDGSFDVVETLVFRTPQNWLVLAPPSARLGGDALKSARPRAAQFRVTTAGRPLDVGMTEVDKDTAITLPETVNRVELHYRLTGATVRSAPSTGRRALSLVAPLSAATDDSLRTTVAVRGTTVLNLTCPLLPASRQLCAPTSGPNADTVGNIAAADAVVVAQVDLPAQPS